jgi:hypothetical protein
MAFKSRRYPISLSISDVMGSGKRLGLESNDIYLLIAILSIVLFKNEYNFSKKTIFLRSSWCLRLI